jgi:hypothetical protein
VSHSTLAWPARLAKACSRAEQRERPGRGALADVIFGKTVRDAYFHRGGLNDNGDIAFSFYSTDNYQFIAVASPAILGDSDLNGVINFDDYVNIDRGFNNHLTGWANGDFDGNGIINFDDYVLIDRSFLEQGNGGGRGLNGVVPEPAMLSVLAPAAMLLRRRRA